MKVLMDTHALLWAINGDEKLGKEAVKAFNNPETELFFSMAGYWEICIKISLGKLQLADDWVKIIEKEMNLNSIKWLQIQKGHLEALVNLPFHHRDPFDRLMVAQALCENMTLMTKDNEIGKYAISILW
ncbi:MAG: PIN domain nuclease [Spirochaetes bacterium]|nr:MAG: PIN domain nuclease [Spirochaetota bacterium]